MTFTSPPRNRTLLLVPFLLLLVMALAFAPTASARYKAPKRVVALTPFAANTMAYLGVKPIAVGQTLGGDRRLAPVLRPHGYSGCRHPNGPNLEQLVNRVRNSSSPPRSGARARRR